MVAVVLPVHTCLPLNVPAFPAGQVVGCCPGAAAAREGAADAVCRGAGDAPDRDGPPVQDGGCQPTGGLLAHAGDHPCVHRLVQGEGCGVGKGRCAELGRPSPLPA
eukprot:366445-Chlamydomonas_euryale.AAC.11